MLWEVDDPVTLPGNMPIDDTWKLTFDEEFNGTKLDTTKWTANWLGAEGAITKPINGAELAAYDPACVMVANGSVRLAAVNRAATVAGKTYNYSSGCITTQGKFSQACGYFQARVYSPATSDGKIANWPAFWTDGQNWPADGECDAFEGLSGRGAYHWHCSGGDYGATVIGTFTGWHTYGVLWTATAIGYYYDDQLVGTIQQGIVSKPHFLICNYGVGGYGGPTVVPATMQIDYVRAWSKDPNAVAVPPQPGYVPPDAAGGGGTDEAGQDAAIKQLQTDVAQLKSDVQALDGRLDKIASGAVG